MPFGIRLIRFCCTFHTAQGDVPEAEPQPTSRQHGTSAYVRITSV